MIEMGTFNVAGGALGDGAQLLDGSSAGAAVETLVALAQCFGDGASKGLAGLLGNGLREPVSFRVLNVEAHVASILPQNFLAFLHHHSPSRIPAPVLASVKPAKASTPARWLIEPFSSRTTANATDPAVITARKKNPEPEVVIGSAG